MQTISLCMIVKNEERFLHKCLEYASKHVDEIIIVDTGSIDSTIEIAKKFNAEIYHFDWINDFAAARNFSISKATKEYILVLDADEYLDDKSNIQEDLVSEKDYYTVRIRNVLSNGSAMFHPAIRLFKNHIELKYFGSVHEHLEISNPLLKDAYAKNTFIHHEGYIAENYKEKNKHERNLELLLGEVANNPSGYNYFNLGTQYKANHQFEEALEAYQEAFNKSKDKVYINMLLYHIGDCLFNLKRYAEALDVIDGSIESFPFHTDFYFLKGLILEELGYNRDAINAFEKCLELGEVDFTESYEGVGSFLSSIRIGNIYLKEGNMIEALDKAYEGITSNNKYLPALRLYLEVMMKTGINNKDINIHLDKMYVIKDLEGLKNLIIVLVALKSPLILTYIEKYKLPVDDSVKVIALQYAGEYAKAADLWKQKDSIEKIELKDVLLLAYIQKDLSLFNLAVNECNLNINDIKILRKLIERQSVNIQKVSKELEELFSFFTEQLLKLNHEEGFNFLILQCMNKQVPISLKVVIARVVLNYNYVEIARDIALSMFEENTSNVDLLNLLGDICVKQNLIQEALSFYFRSLSIQPQYAVYERVYMICEKNSDLDRCILIKKEIIEKFPLVQWTRDHSLNY